MCGRGGLLRSLRPVFDLRLTEARPVVNVAIAPSWQTQKKFDQISREGVKRGRCDVAAL
jgi:hypothetical protein